MSFIDQTIGHMREILMINRSIVYVTSLKYKKGAVTECGFTAF